jgi:hypothetical protein
VCGGRSWKRVNNWRCPKTLYRFMSWCSVDARQAAGSDGQGPQPSSRWCGDNYQARGMRPRGGCQTIQNGFMNANEDIHELERGGQGCAPLVRGSGNHQFVPHALDAAGPLREMDRMIGHARRRYLSVQSYHAGHRRYVNILMLGSGILVQRSLDLGCDRRRS